MIKYIVPLAPVTKKNSQRIFRGKNGRPFIVPSKQYKDYEQSAMWYLKPVPDHPVCMPSEVKCLFYMPTRRRVDLTNLLEAIDDIMVKAGILEDDNFNIIASHDGSRVLYDKENPRTEIYIEEMEENA